MSSELSNKKYETLYSTSGGGDNDVSAIVSKAENLFDDERAVGMKYYLEHPDFAPFVFAIKQLQEEIDYLRTEIALNKRKTPISTGGNTTLSFSDLISTTVKGSTTYSIRLTATRDFGGKVGTQTKSIILRLT